MRIKNAKLVKLAITVIYCLLLVTMCARNSETALISLAAYVPGPASVSLSSGNCCSSSSKGGIGVERERERHEAGAHSVSDTRVAGENVRNV